MPFLLRAFPDVASQIQTVQLGDTSYRVRLDWRERCSAWYFSISTLAGVEILNSVRIEPQQPIMRFADPANFPDGVIITAKAGILGDPGTKGTAWITFDSQSPLPAVIAAGAVFRVPGEDHSWVTITDSGVPESIGAFSWRYAPIQVEASIPGALEAAAGAITEIVTSVLPPPFFLLNAINTVAAIPGTDAVEVVRPDLPSDLLLTFYLTSELPDAEADADAPTVTIP